MKRILCLIVLLLTACDSGSQETNTEVHDAMRLHHLALAAIDSGHADQAIEYLDRLQALLPEEASINANLGVAALRQNRLDDAIRHFEEANLQAQNNHEIAILMSQTLALQGKFEEAAKVLDKPMILDDGNNIKLHWASAELNRGNDSKQILDASKILMGAKQNLVARLMMTKALLGEGELSMAKIQLESMERSGYIQGETAKTLFNNAMQKIEEGDARAAKAQVIGLDNVLKPTRAWQHSLLELAGPPGTIGHPVRSFINVQEPEQSPPDSSLPTFTLVTESVIEDIDHAVLLVETEDRSSLVVARGSEIDALQDSAGYINVGSNITLLVPIDWNNDRFLDVVVGTKDGSIVLLEQSEPAWRLSSLIEGNGNAVDNITPWDADHDGDLDLLVSTDSTFLLQNNADNTVTSIKLDAPRLHDANIIDIDEDGAVDVVAINDTNKLILLRNLRSGKIVPENTLLPDVQMQSLTTGDVNNDGWIDLAWVDFNGAAYHGINEGGESIAAERVGGNGNSVVLLDSNNNGWLETLVVGEDIQLIGKQGQEQVVPTTGQVQIVDANLDGLLDMLVVGEEFAAWHQDKSNNNNFQKVVLEAILEGGQRNNAVGVGGFIEVKSGGKYQKRFITGPLTHIGLGSGQADVIRVVWPNGVPQDVVEPVPNQVFTEVQILKGSCPFLATKVNGKWKFVTDLLWRSPLGLKINAQTVPPIAATQDWVKVTSEQLQPQDGYYECAITAQLWETHFIDEIKLIAIDHPIGTEIFVDERFVAPIPPAFKLYTYEEIHRPIAVTNHVGLDVTDKVKERDGLRLGGFAKGLYQGIAENHFVELEFKNVDTTLPIDIVASGWIRPTDTSINVASSQGNHPIPKAIEVEVFNHKGEWETVISNGGFPAGKLKTIVLELPPDVLNASDIRIRLKTNLEIYWDRIVIATHEDVPYIQQEVELLDADLDYFGYPEMSRKNQNAPNVPDYENIQHFDAWRDLIGYYTRYGRVNELLESIDDRYVIMNAGDAMFLNFKALRPPAIGMTRNFIFFSDGWVKDGDWNTVDSKTVGPLPHHSMSDYPYPEHEMPKSLLPSHPDWAEYHTRFIDAKPFRDALKE